MRRLVRCVCLLLLLAQAAGCKSSRQSTVSQRGVWGGEAVHGITAVLDSVMRYEFEGGTRWEWTQLDYSLDTVRPDSATPHVRITRLTRTATVAARHERAVSDSLGMQSAGQMRARGELSTRDERQTRTSGLPSVGLAVAAVAVAIVISFIYIIKRR